MLKLTDNPPMLYPEGASIRDIPGRWWVAHTKARFEKAFAWDLATRDIPCFLPMYPRTTFSGGRKRHGLSPLFTSYVFFAGDEQSRYAALTTDRLCQVIPVPNQPRLLSELAAIHAALATGAPIDPYPFATPGRRCRITAGPFMGIEGTVIDRDGITRLVLQVSILGQGASLEIDSGLMEPIE